MSEDNKPVSGTAPDAPRRAQSIDLTPDAVKDITPKADRGAAQADAPAQSAPQPEPVRPPEDRPARGGAAVGAGAVAGAIFGLLGSIVYQNVQKPSVTVADPRVAQVEAAIAAVEKKAVEAGQLEQRLVAQIRAVEGKAAAVDTRAAGVEQKAAALDQKAQALEQKTVALDEKTAAVAARAAEVEKQALALIQPVDTRLKAAETRLGAAAEQAVSLGKKVDLLAQIEPPKLDLKPIVNKVEELERAVASSAARATLNGESVLAFDGRIKGVEASVKGLDGAAKGLETSVKGVEAGLGALKQPRPVETAAAVLSVTNLARRAFESGEALGGFATAFSALGVSAAALQPLAPFAQTPAPNATGLADLYAGLAAKAPKPVAAEPPKVDGLLDRVTSGLLSQVEVRKVGIAAGPDATGIAAQVRARLLAGDFAGAVQLVVTLPAEQQAALKPFVDAVNARASALNALRQIETDALAAASRKG